MSGSNTYEPLGEEPLEEGVNVKRRTKRSSSRRKRGGGKGKAVLLLGLLILAIVAVVLAIVLPITLSSSASSRSGTAVASTGVGPNALVSPLGQTIPPANGAPAATPVPPNMNAGDIVCYRSSTGQLMPGGLRRTGVTRTTSGVLRAEVESCSSRNTFYVTASRLETCTEPCLTPVWAPEAAGLAAAPIWQQDFVCQGNQVFLNTKTAQNSFYFTYGATVRETLVQECDTNRGWWVADQELRVCLADESAACNQKNAARTAPRTAPEIVAVGAPGSVLRAGPVCVINGANVFKTTGVVQNRFIWWRLMRVNEAPVTFCNGTVAPNPMVDVKTIVPCTDAARATCP